MSVHVPRETIEAFESTVTASADPTSTPPAFAFVQGDDRPTTWHGGTWSGSYSSGKATAVTPTIGLTASGADVELAVGTWNAYVKVTDSPEIPVRACGTVRLT